MKTPVRKLWNRIGSGGRCLVLVVAAIAFSHIAANSEDGLVAALELAGVVATVLLIYNTFWATNRTARAAENGQKAHVFATVRFDLVKDPAKEGDPDAALDHIEPIVIIENYGATPARDVEVGVIFDQLSASQVELANNSLPQSIRDGLCRFSGPQVLPPFGCASSAPVRPRDPKQLRKRLSEDPTKSQYAVWCEVKYRTIFMDLDEQKIECREVHRATLDIDFTAVVVKGLEGKPWTVEDIVREAKGVRSLVERYERDLPVVSVAS